MEENLQNNPENKFIDFEEETTETPHFEEEMAQKDKVNIYAKKNTDFEDDEDDEDFKDIEEENNDTEEQNLPQTLEEVEKNETGEDIAQEINTSQEEPKEEIKEEPKEENIEQTPSEEMSPWEELSKTNSIVKKYIFYVAKDFTSYIDNLSTDDRNVFINDAIQLKLDTLDEKKQQNKKKKLMTHLVLMILTFIIATPLFLFLVNKSIMMTFDNYKYSQDNFEKLYKQRFFNDRAYMRSVQYNQKQIEKKQKQAK